VITTVQSLIVIINCSHLSIQPSLGSHTTHSCCPFIRLSYCTSLSPDCKVVQTSFLFCVELNCQFLGKSV